MSSWALGVAWVLSVVSLLISLPSEVGSGALARTTLAALPWVALTGLPHRLQVGDVKRKPWWGFYGYMLPILAVALGLDYSASIEPLVLLRLTSVVLLATGILAWAAGRSSVSPSYACLWAALIPMPLAVAVLPEWNILESTGLSRWVAATPSGWTLSQLFVSPAEVEIDFARSEDFGLLFSLALLFALSFFFRAEEVE